MDDLQEARAMYQGSQQMITRLRAELRQVKSQLQDALKDGTLNAARGSATRTAIGQDVERSASEKIDAELLELAEDAVRERKKSEEKIADLKKKLADLTFRRGEFYGMKRSYDAMERKYNEIKGLGAEYKKLHKLGSLPEDHKKLLKEFKKLKGDHAFLKVKYEKVKKMYDRMVEKETVKSAQECAEKKECSAPRKDADKSLPSGEG